jgi:hypothetical protein
MGGHQLTKRSECEGSLSTGARGWRRSGTGHEDRFPHVAEGRVFVVGTDRSLTFRELAKAVYSEMGRLPAEVREELEVTKLYDGVVNLAARGMLVVSVARRLGSEGPLPTYCVARSNRAGPEKGAPSPLS